MILAPKTNCKGTASRGMSLLEVVVALLLVGVLMTLGLSAYNARSNDANLRKAATEIESLASRARTLSFLTQRPHRLALIGESHIVLEKPSGPSESKAYAELDQYSSDINLWIRRWGAKDDEWIRYDNRNQPAAVYWYFSPSGLTEPLSMRLTEGESWIVLHMDPLTGRVQEEESYIK